MATVRYEYDKKRLFIQFPCATHERVIAAFSAELHKSMFALHALEPKLELCWTVTANSEAPYDDDDDDGGMFITDLTLCGRSSAPILLLEVVFTQRWAEARDKMKKMLDQGTIFGIVAVNIKEHPVWKKPEPRVDAQLPVINEDKFRRIAVQSQKANPYVGLSIGGYEWTRRVTCDVYLFPCGCDVEAIRPVRFSFVTDNAPSLK